MGSLCSSVTTSETIEADLGSYLERPPREHLTSPKSRAQSAKVRKSKSSIEVAIDEQEEDDETDGRVRRENLFEPDKLTQKMDEKSRSDSIFNDADLEELFTRRTMARNQSIIYSVTFRSSTMPTNDPPRSEIKSPAVATKKVSVISIPEGDFKEIKPSAESKLKNSKTAQ